MQYRPSARPRPAASRQAGEPQTTGRAAGAGGRAGRPNGRPRSRDGRGRTSGQATPRRSPAASARAAPPAAGAGGAGRARRWRDGARAARRRRIDGPAQTAAESQAPAEPVDDGSRRRRSGRATTVRTIDPERPISEAGGRCSALRRGHQRRRRAARALHRRAARAARRGRGAHHVRARLHHVEERAARRRGDGQRRPRAALSGRRGRATPTTSAGARSVVFEQTHSIADELAWLDSEGPTSPALDPAHRARRATTFDFFSSSAIATTTRGTARARCRTRPCSCRRPSAIRRSGLAIFAPVFRGARALMFNSLEERALIQGVSGRDGPGRRRRRRIGDSRAHAAVALPQEVQRQAAVRDLRRPHRREQGLRGAVRRTSSATRRCIRTGSTSCSSGRRTCRSRSIRGSGISGFLSDEDKFDALAAADVLIMPSPYESLSMVALEAWALGKPVLANGRCDVLRGQCVRSNGGLYYETFEEFAEALYALEAHRPARRRSSAATAASSSGALHVAGDRAEVPRHVRPAASASRRGAMRSAAGLLRAAAARRCRPRSDVVDARAVRTGGASDARAARPSGARDARLRRRHRPRGPRHPARAARAPASSRRSSSRPPIRGSRI